MKLALRITETQRTKERCCIIKKNVGKIDQTIRYVVAIILVVLAILITPGWSWFLLIPAVILAFTAGVSWCALYQLIGFNSCKFDKQ